MPIADAAMTDGVIAVIPARYASSRFPSKPLAPVLGIPLVVRVFERVARALPRSQVYVATDDARIRDVCEAADIRVVMTPPQCLTGTDRTWEAVHHLDGELIVNVQGDEPLVDPDDIAAVIRAKRAWPTMVINAMCRMTDRREIESPHVPKVVVNGEGTLVYMSRAPVPFAKDRSVDVLYRRQVCIYGFARRELERFAAYGRKSPLEEPEDIEILRFLDIGIAVKMVEVHGHSIAVDVPDDIPRVEAILRSLAV